MNQAGKHKVIVLSCSLNPKSRSRILAKYSQDLLATTSFQIEWIDMHEYANLPFCDGSKAYSHPDVQKLSEKISAAQALLIASPIYNYDVNAVLKNLLELTGRNAWVEKVIGLMCSAGGRSSYMALMPFVNSLLLDFRCDVLPRFVYAVESDFGQDSIESEIVRTRLQEMVNELVQRLA